MKAIFFSFLLALSFSANSTSGNVNGKSLNIKESGKYSLNYAEAKKIEEYISTSHIAGDISKVEEVDMGISCTTHNDNNRCLFEWHAESGDKGVMLFEIINGKIKPLYNDTN